MPEYLNKFESLDEFATLTKDAISSDPSIEYPFDDENPDIVNWMLAIGRYQPTLAKKILNTPFLSALLPEHEKQKVSIGGRILGGIAALPVGLFQDLFDFGRKMLFLLRIFAITTIMELNLGILGILSIPPSQLGMNAIAVDRIKTPFLESSNHSKLNLLGMAVSYLFINPIYHLVKMALQILFYTTTFVGGTALSAARLAFSPLFSFYNGCTMGIKKLRSLGKLPQGTVYSPLANISEYPEVLPVQDKPQKTTPVSKSDSEVSMKTILKSLPHVEVSQQVSLIASQGPQFTSPISTKVANIEIAHKNNPQSDRLSLRQKN